MEWKSNLFVHCTDPAVESQRGWDWQFCQRLLTWWSSDTFMSCLDFNKRLPPPPKSYGSASKNYYMLVSLSRTHINMLLIDSYVSGLQKVPCHQKYHSFLCLSASSYTLYCSLKRLYDVYITYGNATAQTAERTWRFPLKTWFSTFEVSVAT